MVLLSKRFVLMLLSKSSPTTPIRHAELVWALPVSLATTRGIICYFLFLLLLRCFSSQGWLIFRCDMSSTCRVVPFGDLRVKRLYASNRSLSQLTTSFFAAQCQGIHHTPLFRFKNFKDRIKPITAVNAIIGNLYWIINRLKVSSGPSFSTGHRRTAPKRNTVLVFYFISSLLRTLITDLHP